MNASYKKLKAQYDAIDAQVLALYQDQQAIRAMMEQVCTHEDLGPVIPDPYSLEEEPQVKCRDCYRYFKKSEVAQRP